MVHCSLTYQRSCDYSQQNMIIKLFNTFYITSSLLSQFIVFCFLNCKTFFLVETWWLKCSPDFSFLMNGDIPSPPNFLAQLAPANPLSVNSSAFVA